MPANIAKKRPRVGPGRLSAEDAAGLPDRLLDAAFFQFTEHGFGGATMDQIAKRAGASTKTLYSRFDNKSEILEAVIRRNVQRTVADHLRAFALQPAESDPREFLFKFGMQIGVSALTDETAGLSRLTFAEAHRFPVLARLYKEVTGRGVTAIAAALQIWREQGKVDFDLDAEHLAALCFDMMTAEARARAVIGDPWTRRELERYVALAVDVFLRGITPDFGKRKSKRK